MKLIVAVNKKNYIGKDGKLMWKCKQDMQHFKDSTTGGIVIVGETTFKNDLRGKPLKNRYNVVIGSNKEQRPDGPNVVFCNSLGSAIEAAVSYKYLGQKFIAEKELEIWVIGGQSIYEHFLPLCDEIHISIIDDEQVGDRMFIVPPNCRGKVVAHFFQPDDFYIVKEDMICPATQLHCDDECCTVGSICNVKPGNNLVNPNPYDNGQEKSGFLSGTISQ